MIRGIKNKNPPNIKCGSNWIGLVRGSKSDSEFAIFVDMNDFYED